MKKFFTLTLALMATITLWAQEFTFTGSTLPSGWTGTETGSSKFSDNTSVLKISSSGTLTYTFESPVNLTSIDFVYSFGSKDANKSVTVTAKNTSGTALGSETLSQETKQTGSNVRQEKNLSFSYSGVKTIFIENISGKNFLLGYVKFYSVTITKVVTINPNGGSYASTPEGWDFSEGVYTKSVAEGSFQVPAGLTKEDNDLTGWQDNHGNTITMPFSLDKDTTLVAQWAAHQTSSDATLADLTVAGETIEGFDPATIEYNVELPFGTSVVPVVAGTANSPYAKSVEANQAAALPGVATIVVTAEDNSQQTYTINFSLAGSKDLLLVFRTSITACESTPSTATAILSNDASVSTYINQITFTNVEGDGDNGAETGGKSGNLSVGKKAGNMFTLSTKKGYAISEMNFKGKIQDATCEYSIDGGNWMTLTSTDTSNDACYNPFSNAEVCELRLRSTGTEGVWIRNMQLTIVNSSKTPTGIDNTEDEVKAVKYFKDGQLFIEKNGHVYNVFGACIK